MSRDRESLPLRHAIALGLAQGPTELLPISSSAHTALVPWLAGWRYAELDGAARKSADSTRLRALSGNYEPRVSLREGIEEMVQWYYRTFSSRLAPAAGV